MIARRVRPGQDRGGATWRALRAIILGADPARAARFAFGGLIDSVQRDDMNLVAACGGVVAVSVAVATTAADPACPLLDLRTGQ